MGVIVINNKNITAGESTTDLIDDKGFSPDTGQLNLFKVRGALHFNEALTDRGAAILTGNIIADAKDFSDLGVNGFFLDDESNYYTLDGTTFTKRQASVVGSSDDVFLPKLGTNELLPFKGALYATSEYTSGKGDVVKLTGSTLDVIDSQFWTVTEGNASLVASVRHPMESLGTRMFIGDDSNIHTYDGTTSVLNAVALPTGQNITSLRRHPDGIHLMAFTGNTLDYGHTQGAEGKLYLINPQLIDVGEEPWVREIPLIAQVEGTRLVEGIVYCTWGKNFGYFDGSGLVKLKQFETSTTTYSHNISNIEDTLLVRDGLNLLAFGDIGSGNVWWKALTIGGSANINNVAYKGDNKVLVSYADGTAGDLKEIDYDNVGNQGTFISNRYRFGTEVQIKRIEVDHGATDSAGTTTFVLHQRNFAGLINASNPKDSGQIESRSYVNQSVSKSIFNTDIKTSIFQLYLQLIADDIPFYEIRIYYDAIK